MPVPVGGELAFPGGPVQARQWNSSWPATPCAYLSHHVACKQSIVMNSLCKAENVSQLCSSPENQSEDHYPKAVSAAPRQSTFKNYFRGAKPVKTCSPGAASKTGCHVIPAFLGPYHARHLCSKPASQPASRRSSMHVSNSDREMQTLIKPHFARSSNLYEAHGKLQKRRRRQMKRRMRTCVMRCCRACEGLLLRLDESRHIRESSQDGCGCSEHKQRGGGGAGGGKMMGLWGNLRSERTCITRVVVCLLACKVE